MNNTNVTDWIMVAITFAYVITTLYIMIANQKTVKVNKQQLDESRKQYADSQRLAVMPYLQMHFSDSIIDERHKKKPSVQIFLSENMTNDKSSEDTCYCGIDLSDDKELVKMYETEKDKLILHNVSIINHGNGISHHIEFQFDYKGQIFELPSEYIIPGHGGTLEANTALLVSCLRETESENLRKKSPESEPIDSCSIKINVKYEDILGNHYLQEVQIPLLRYNHKVLLLVECHQISAPQLISTHQ